MKRLFKSVFGKLLPGGKVFEGRAQCASCTIYHPTPGHLRLGRNVVLNDAFLDLLAPVTIEDNVFFGHNVRILTGLHDVEKLGLERQCAIVSRPVTIETGVWIASYAVILPGAHIGKNAVVAAGSVVSGRVEPYTVVAGNPARVIREIRARDDER